MKKKKVVLKLRLKQPETGQARPFLSPQAEPSRASLFAWHRSVPGRFDSPQDEPLGSLH